MSWDWAFWIGGGVLGVGALALMGWAMLWDRSRGRRRCGRCWYDMEGVPGLVCPECGRGAKSERGLFRTRRRWRWVAAAVVLGLLACGVAMTPRVIHRGWSETVPMRALMLGLFAFESEAEAAASGDSVRIFARLKLGGGKSRWERLLVAHGLARRLGEPDAVKLDDVKGMWLLVPELELEIEPLLPTMLGLLQAEEPEVRRSAIRALGRIQARRRRVTMALVPMLQDHDQAVVASAADAIGRLCAQEHFFPPAIEGPIENHEMTKAFAEGVLSELAGRGDQAAMRHMLSHPWLGWRLAGIRTCEHWSRYGGPLDVETVGALRRVAADDPRDEVRLRAEEVLAESAAKAAASATEPGGG